MPVMVPPLITTYSRLRNALFAALVAVGIATTSFLLPTVCVAEEPARIWVDSVGRHSVNAALIATDGEFVSLRRGDGQTVMLRVSELSQNDKQYLDAFEKRQLSQDNPLRLNPAASPTSKPLPPLDLLPAHHLAEAGVPLRIADATRSYVPDSTPRSLRSDGQPFPATATSAQFPMARVDLHDTCSRPIPLVNPNSKQVTSIAVSASKGVVAPGNSTNGAILMFDPETSMMKPVWIGRDRIELFDFHAPSQRGLVLVGQDVLGQGGQMVVATGWDEGKLKFSFQRPIFNGRGVGKAPKIRWARWVDEEHFIAVVDQTVGLWNFVSGEQMYRISGIHAKAAPAISSGRRYIAIPREGTVEVRRTSDGVAVGQIPVDDGSLASVAFSPDGDSLALVTSRRLRVWKLGSATLSTDLRVRESLGKRQPTWISNDLILSGSGVLVSLFRQRPVWRYELASASACRLGDHVGLFRKHPDTSLVIDQLPHQGAIEALGRIDSGAAANLDGASILGRSDWQNGVWTDRPWRVSARPKARR